MQIDIGPPTLVTGIITKGRGDSRKSHWVKRFMVTYSNDTERWYNYKDAHHLDPKVCHCMPYYDVIYYVITHYISPLYSSGYGENIEDNDG